MNDNKIWRTEDSRKLSAETKDRSKISKICTYMKIKEYNFFHDCQQSSMFFLTPQLQDFPKVGTLIQTQRVCPPVFRFICINQLLLKSKEPLNSVTHTFMTRWDYTLPEHDSPLIQHWKLTCLHKFYEYCVTYMTLQCRDTTYSYLNCLQNTNA